MLYRNPAYNTTTVRLNSSFEWVKVSVSDLSGNIQTIVLDTTIKEGRHDVKVDLSSLSSGYYVLSIQKDSGNITQKLKKV